MILKKIQFFKGKKYRPGLLIMLLIIGAPFFFLGGPGAHGARSSVALWDMGHVLFFSIASWLLCKQFRYRFPDLSAFTRNSLVFLLVLASGGIVEGLQMGFDGRIPDFRDILRNQLGCLITLVFFDSLAFSKHKKWPYIIQFVTLSMVLVAFYPFVRGVVDEVIAAYQFPVIADFETIFERDRWVDKEIISVEKSLARHGEYSLKVRLNTDTYSGVALCYFPGNWTGYKSLYFSIFHTDKEPLEIVCRIHDADHTNEYADRFNQRLQLQKGWNDFSLLLEDIKHAPASRLLNMKKIVNITFFVIRQEKERIIYLDNIYLEK